MTSATLFREGYDLDEVIAELESEHPGRVRVIDVAYGRDSRRLLRFEGLGNLRDDRGERQLEARIDFPRPGRPADEALWQRFAREPLSACRVRA